MIECQSICQIEFQKCEIECQKECPRISGWWFQPLKNMKVSWDYYSQYMEKYNSCSKPQSDIQS